MTNALAVVCTRISSRRLPGKAMKRIAGRPVLEHILRRLKAAEIPIVLALPHSDSLDLRGEALAGVAVYRGEDESPLHRMAAVARRHPGTEWIVRVTHDDMLVDPQTIKDLVAECARTGACYGYTPSIVDGAGVEVISRENLLEAAARRAEPTEFVSYFVKGDKPLALRPRRSVERQYRLTLDYSEDAIVLEAVMRAVGPDASLDEVVRYLDENQYLLKINRLPELSVYTCAFNAQEHIGTALLSVQATRAVDLEHVVVDDCSTDETLTRAAAFYRDQRLIVNERNLGLASSSNIALGECRGRYVMRLDADDHLINADFEEAWRTIRAMLDSGAVAVYPSYLEVGHGARPGARDPREAHHVGGAVFSKAFLNELRFRDGIRAWDGVELLKRMRAVGAKIEYYERPTWAYRQRADSMSKTNLEVRQQILREVL